MTRERKRPAGASPCAPAQDEAKPKSKSPPKSIRAAAKTHALEALETLASLAQSAASESVRVSAANAVLDRAYGKPVTGARTAASKPAGEITGDVEVQWLDDSES
jgi:hypothetical protein